MKIHLFSLHDSAGQITGHSSFSLSMEYILVHMAIYKRWLRKGMFSHHYFCNIRQFVKNFHPPIRRTTHTAPFRTVIIRPEAIFLQKTWENKSCPFCLFDSFWSLKVRKVVSSANVHYSRSQVTLLWAGLWKNTPMNKM